MKRKTASTLTASNAIVPDHPNLTLMNPTTTKASPMDTDIPEYAWALILVGLFSFITQLWERGVL